MVEAPARDVMLEWIRNQDPSARIAHYLDDGKRMTAVLAHHGGEEIELTGDDEDAVLLACVNRLRAYYQLPPLGAPSKRDALEQDIVAATFAGDDARAATLTRELVMHNRGGAPLQRIRTKFSARTTW